MMTLTLFAESFDHLDTFVHELEAGGFTVNKQSSEHLLETNDISESNFVLLYLDGSDSINKERVAQIKRLTPAPMFVITSDTSEIVRSYYLNIGADGVITEPIPHIETISRINALMRRFSDYQSRTNNKIFKLGPLLFILMTTG